MKSTTQSFIAEQSGVMAARFMPHAQRAPWTRARAVSAAVFAGSVLALSSCASNSAPDRGYVSSQVVGAVESGYIDDVQYFQGGAATTGAGAIIGGVAGGVIGHQIGGGTGNTVATVAGAIGGAVLGNEIERNNNQGGSQYALVRVVLDNGARIDVRQPSDFGLRRGERVRVYDRQRITRG